MSVTEAADDLGRYYQRRTGSLRAGGAQALPGKASTTDTGFTGLTGTLVSDGQAGELSVLANGETMLTVQDLVPPDRAEKLRPQITAMVNSLRVH